MNIAVLCIRDFRELERIDEVRKLAFLWASELETYEDACPMVSTSFVRELMPNEASLKDDISDSPYSQEFRKRVAEKVVFRWSMYMRRITSGKWVRRIEHEITNELWQEIQDLGFNDSKYQVYMQLVGMLRSSRGPTS